jgi:hypothetical protein
MRDFRFGLGCAEMKSKMHEAVLGEDEMSGNEQVRVEIQTFLQAVNSYPDRFARNPDLTFEEHCSSLSPAAKSDPPRRN